MTVSAASAQRLRQARRRLAMSRQRLRRLALLARNPEELDGDMALLGRTAFMRALLRSQLQPRPGAGLCAMVLLEVAGADVALLRAVGMLLLENTRGCDVVGRVGTQRFAVLLKGASEADAARIAARLQRRVRELASSRRVLARVSVVSRAVDDTRWPETLLDDLARRLPASAARAWDQDA